jgi:Flp pilus assembly pilin Flp
MHVWRSAAFGDRGCVWFDVLVQEIKVQIQNKQLGQGMTEYIVIVALIAVAAIAAYQFFGQTIRSQTAGIAAEVSGKSASTAIGQAQKYSGEVAKEGDLVKGLDNYKNENSQGGGGK